MVKRKIAKSKTNKPNNPFEDNNLKIVLIICATALIMFFSYQFYFSSHATCVRAEVAIIKDDYKKRYEPYVWNKYKDDELMNIKRKCSIRVK
jgi:Tfp pilus assembly protein PilO